MDLAVALKQMTAPVIIVDDHYGAPNVSNIDGKQMSVLARTLKKNPAAHKALKELLGARALAPDKAARAATSPDAAQRLWQAYEAEPAAHGFLDPLFKDVYEERKADLARLKNIEDFCSNETGKPPLTFSNLESAKDALTKCALAFVDFNLTQQANVNETIGVHSQYAECYQAGFEFSNEHWPKIVVLISSNMPSQQQLGSFRESTHLRAAFFNALRKAQISPERLTTEMARWQAEYPASAELDRYLTCVKEAVAESAREVSRNLDRLETHDLAMLDTFKLSAEQESLQSYVTWLIGESLASRLRRQVKLQKKLLSEKMGDAPLDGKLIPNSVLFEMFADVATSPVTLEPNISFGDVFLSTSTKPDDQASRYVVAISPACDLIRCDDSYDVLCVRGKGGKATTSLKTMLTTASALFGKGSHVMRYQGNTGKPKYAHVTWEYQQGLHSLKAKDLKDSKLYKHVARLSDSFAQEVKELALSHASRVGIPVDPTFAIAASAFVRIKVKRPVKDGEIIEHEQNLNGEEFTCAVASRARITLPGKEDPSWATMLVLTSQFVTWLREEFLAATIKKAGDEPIPLLGEFDAFLKDWSKPQLVGKKPATEFSGRLIVHYGQDPQASTLEVGKMEIFLLDSESQ